MKKEIKNLKEKIKKTNNYLIMAHKNPDHDAFGSMYFMTNYLKKMNKNAYWDIHSEISSVYHNMLDDIRDEHYKDEKIDCIITLDSANLERTGYTGKRYFTINIDHHVSNSRYGDINYVRPDLSSTAEVLYNIFWENKFDINKKFKKSILLGILGDTGFLKYDNATKDTIAIVSKLTDGIKIFDIYKEFNRILTKDHLNFLKTMISLLQEDENIYYIALNEEILKRSNLLYEDISNLFTIFRDIQDAENIILFREVKKGITRVNFRGNNTLDLNKVASYFGGGGHANAAACTVTGTFDTIVKNVMNITKKYAKEEK